MGQNQNTFQPTRFRQEPAFLLDQPSKIRLSGKLTRRSKRYLAGQVIRNPNQLQTHLQRIFFLIDTADTEQLEGALFDLFITLGIMGGELRTSLLTICKPYISHEAFSYLSGKNLAGIDAYHDCPNITCSLLSKGYSGSRKMAKKIDRQQTQTSPLEEAIERLEYGQVEEAQQILQTAHAQDPNDPEIKKELLILFQYQRDAAALKRFRKQLKDNGVTESREWALLQEEFEAS